MNLNQVVSKEIIVPYKYYTIQKYSIDMYHKTAKIKGLTKNDVCVERDDIFR